MPTISVVKQDLETLAGQTYDLSALASALEVAKAEVSPEDEDRLRIQLKDTNRPDLWSSEGIARLLRGYRLGRHDTYAFFEATSTDREIRVDGNIESIRPYVAAFVCQDIQINDAALEQLIEAQERLTDNYGRGRQTVAIGIYDASGIVFPVHYEAVDPASTRFIPLETEVEMDLNQILREHPTGRTYAHLLEGLEKFPLLRDSGGEVLSMPPIINSQTLGRVQACDSFLLCEATGTVLDAVLLSCTIMAVNMADRGGRIHPVRVTYPYDTPRGREIQSPFDLTEPIQVAMEEVRKVLGIELGADKIEDALNAMGYQDVVVEQKVIRARPAPYRDDILHPVDLIEDVAVAVGYDTIGPEPLQDFTIGKAAPQEDLSDRIRELMVGCGFQELFLPILCARDDLTTRLRNPDEAVVEIENPMSDSYSAVRNSLLPGMLRVESVSRRAIYPHRIFEVGEVAVIAPEEDYGCLTQVRLAAVEASSEANLSGIQSHLEALAYFLRVDYSLNAIDHPSFLPGRAGEICKAGTPYGIIGEIHPEVLEIWGIGVPVSAFEVDIRIAE